jgi:hypothetical protein
VLIMAMVAVAGTGCMHRVPQPMPAAYAEVTQAVSAGLVARYDQELHDFGLSPLRSRTLPPGHRELRLRSSSGPGGVPHVFMRIVDRAERGATAEWIALWPEDLPRLVDRDRQRAYSTRMRVRMRREWRCGPIARVGETNFCRLALLSGPRAAALVARLDAAGAWRLPTPVHAPAPSGTVNVQLDGRSVLVEALDGVAYQTKLYGQRDMRADSAVLLLYRLGMTVGGGADPDSSAAEPGAAADASRS